MEATNQVAKQASKPGAVATVNAWNSEQKIAPSSISAPRLHVMQPMSKLVAAGKATVGEVVKLPSGVSVCKKDGSFELIPLGLIESWNIEEKIGNKYEYRGREPRHAANDDLPWEFRDKGTDWRRTKVQEYFVLLLEDVKREVKALEAIKKGGFADPDDALLPAMLTFNGLAIKTGGKEISTYFAKAQHFNSPLFYATFKLAPVTETNSKGTWWRYSVSKSGKTPQEYYDVCSKWQGMINRGVVQAVEDEIAAEAPAERPLDNRF